ncbi:hypothetical protein ACWD3Z_05285 [Streptomyces sp. NPDC002740]
MTMERHVLQKLSAADDEVSEPAPEAVLARQIAEAPVGPVADMDG